MRHFIYWVADNEDFCFLVSVVLLMFSFGMLVFMNSYKGFFIGSTLYLTLIYIIKSCVEYKLNKSKNINNNYK